MKRVKVLCLCVFLNALTASSGVCAAPEAEWKRVMSWEVKKGSRGVVRRLLSRPFKVRNEWRIRCRTRPARTREGRLRIRVYPAGSKEPLPESIAITGSGITRREIVLKETGAFQVGIDANTVWWWAHVEERNPKWQEARSKHESVAARLRAGEIWVSQTTDKGFTNVWLKADTLSREELVKARDRIEAAYDSGSRSVPAGDAGARMMLRLLARMLGPNTDPKNALQIRTCSIFPRAISAKWTDKAGKEHLHTHRIRDTGAYASLINKQMQTWSNKLFAISGGKLAIYYKTLCPRKPLTQFRRRRGRYWVSPGCARPLVEVNPNDVVLFIFWIPTDGPDFPPKGCSACYESGKLRAGSKSRCIFVFTSLDRLKRPDGWTRLSGGLPHECWHFTQSLLRSGKFRSFIPSNHKREHWQALRDEIAMQGMKPPRSQYEDLYPTIMSWRLCNKLRRRYGWRDWGKGPETP